MSRITGNSVAALYSKHNKEVFDKSQAHVARRLCTAISVGCTVVYRCRTLWSARWEAPPTCDPITSLYGYSQAAVLCGPRSESQYHVIVRVEVLSSTTTTPAQSGKGWAKESVSRLPIRIMPHLHRAASGHRLGTLS